MKALGVTLAGTPFFALSALGGYYLGWVVPLTVLGILGGAAMLAIGMVILENEAER